MNYKIDSRVPDHKLTKFYKTDKWFNIFQQSFRASSNTFLQVYLTLLKKIGLYRCLLTGGQHIDWLTAKGWPTFAARRPRLNVCFGWLTNVCVCLWTADWLTELTKKQGRWGAIHAGQIGQTCPLTTPDATTTASTWRGAQQQMTLTWPTTTMRKIKQCVKTAQNHSVGRSADEIETVFLYETFNSAVGVGVEERCCAIETRDRTLASTNRSGVLFRSICWTIQN